MSQLLQSHHDPANPTAAAEDAVQAAIRLARAEAAVVLAHAQKLAVRAVVAMVLAVVTGFLLHCAVALLTIAPWLLVEAQLELPQLLLILSLPVVVALIGSVWTYQAVQRVLRTARSANPTPHDRSSSSSSLGDRNEPHIVR